MNETFSITLNLFPNHKAVTRSFFRLKIFPLCITFSLSVEKISI